MWNYHDGLGWFLGAGIVAIALSHAPGGALGLSPTIDWRLTMQEIKTTFERGALCGEDPNLCIELSETVR